ncbi:hypothetical protein BDV96DRAFT_195056 [Lophiotrema nucula]|uniref:Uncharacterized protein n=1 Tax=Lophiotrema nucula TaxID=690887 RepID=A0A6A5YTR4_9PLEO|nr:hypothetical protein BDV96DRAFT_195056 [Lophiotrema nucula]
MTSLELPLRPAMSQSNTSNEKLRLLDLPLTLVQDIVEHAVAVSSTLYAILHLHLVNRNYIFHREVFKYLSRNCLDLVPYDDQLPAPPGLKEKLIREQIGNGDCRSSDFQSHVHALVDDLVSVLSKLACPPAKSREEVLEHVCHVVMRVGYHPKLFGANWRIPEWQIDYRQGGTCRS